MKELNYGIEQRPYEISIKQYNISNQSISVFLTVTIQKNISFPTKFEMANLISSFNKLL